MAKVLLGQCKFNDKSRVLTRADGSKTILPHIVADVLILLYTNRERFITTDELKAVVWKDKIVEDRTVMRNISSVRKELGESSNNKYIENKRNEGYRFIAKVQKIDFINLAYLKLPLSLIVFSSILLQTYQYMFVPAVMSKPETLTTMIGQETDGAMGAKTLVFSYKTTDSNYWNIYGRRLDGDRYFKLTSGEFNDTLSSFSPDGKTVAFHRYEGSKCMIMKATLNPISMAFENEEVIFKCIDGLSAVSTTWIDNENLYVSIAESLPINYRVFHLNLRRNEATSITTPDNGGAGDYYVSYSQAAQRLIFFRYNVDSFTEIWSYDPFDNETTFITSVPMILFSLSFIDEGNRIVVRSGTGKLTAIDLNKPHDREIILDANYPINTLFTIDDDTLGYVHGNMRIADVVKASLDGQVEIIASSSFHDRLPAYARDTGDVVFLSTRSGHYQLWKVSSNGDLRQLSHFDNSYRIGHLAVSNDGKYITYTINSQIHLMTMEGEEIFTSNDSILYQNPVFSSDGQTLYYSVYLNNEWRIESRLIENIEVPINLTRGTIAQPCIDDSCLYIVRSDEQNLFIFKENTIADTGIDIGKISYPNQYHVTEQHIYYVRSEQRKIG